MLLSSLSLTDDQPRNVQLIVSRAEQADSAARGCTGGSLASSARTEGRKRRSASDEKEADEGRAKSEGDRCVVRCVGSYRGQPLYIHAHGRHASTSDAIGREKRARFCLPAAIGCP